MWISVNVRDDYWRTIVSPYAEENLWLRDWRILFPIITLDILHAGGSSVLTLATLAGTFCHGDPGSCRRV